MIFSYNSKYHPSRAARFTPNSTNKPLLPSSSLLPSNTEQPIPLEVPAASAHPQQHSTNKSTILYCIILYSTILKYLPSSTRLYFGHPDVASCPSFPPSSPPSLPIKPKPQTPASHRALPLAYKQGRSSRAKSGSQGAHAARDEPLLPGVVAARIIGYGRASWCRGKGKKSESFVFGGGGALVRPMAASSDRWTPSPPPTDRPLL
jgi:hypothetical protein